MNIHLPAILMWTTGVQGFDTLPSLWGLGGNSQETIAYFSNIFWEERLGATGASKSELTWNNHGSTECLQVWPSAEKHRIPIASTTFDCIPIGCVFVLSYCLSNLCGLYLGIHPDSSCAMVGWIPVPSVVSHHPCWNWDINREITRTCNINKLICLSLSQCIYAYMYI